METELPRRKIRILPRDSPHSSFSVSIPEEHRCTLYGVQVDKYSITPTNHTRAANSLEMFPGPASSPQCSRQHYPSTGPLPWPYCPVPPTHHQPSCPNPLSRRLPSCPVRPRCCPRCYPRRTRSCRRRRRGCQRSRLLGQLRSTWCWIGVNYLHMMKYRRGCITVENMFCVLCLVRSGQRCSPFKVDVADVRGGEVQPVDCRHDII